ncbi:MAG: hypothetical protein QW318_03330 [Candidatus Caldarchaeum sp.]|uniref:WD40 repeat domain-containing protein n=2 Tax=Caldiarchaeum subterraneum TaxID=311458 RepID=A0A7J3G2Z5_CALS0
MRSIVFLISLSLLFSTLITHVSASEEPFLKIRIEPLTIGGDLYSAALSQDRVVAVGRSGSVVIWGHDRLSIFSVSQSDLLSISCMERICVAVGAKGVVAEIDPHAETYRSYTVSQKDLSRAALSGGTAAIAARTEVLIYRLGGVISRTIDVGADVSSITWRGSEVLVAAGGRILSLDPETGSSKLLMENKNMKMVNVYDINGRLWVLTDKGLMVDGNLTLPGQFSGMKPVPRGFILYRDQLVSFYDVIDRKLYTVANLLQKASDIVAYGEAFVAVGPSGYLAIVEEGVERRLAAPMMEYAAAVSDGGGGVLVASKTGSLLHYRDGVFTAYLMGDQPKAMALVYGDIVILGRQGLWVFDRGELKAVQAAVRAEDFNDIAPSSTLWVTLVGAGGKVAEVGRGGELSTEQPTTNNLLAVTRGFAVGDKVAVMLGPETRVSKQESKLVDVQSTACGAIAVSDSGEVVYLRKDSITKSQVAGKPKLTTVSVNPRGAYALAGGMKGELVMYDGYNATVLPTALPEEVRAIAWIDERTAIIATSKAVYRLVELGLPNPFFEVKAPRNMDVFSGSSRKIELTLLPRYGYSGKAEISISATGLGQYLSVNPRILSATLDPLCPSKASLELSAYPEAPEGSAAVNLLYQGRSTSIAINIAKPGTGNQQAQPIALPADIQLLALFGIAAIGAVLVFKKLIARR